MSVRNLDVFFNPRSIAVIGASRDPRKVGYQVLDTLRRFFKGKIYPVNPNAAEIQGLKCYPSVKDIPDEVDLAVIAVRADIVPTVLEECGEKGVKSAIIISSGFSEVGRKDLEEKFSQVVIKELEKGDVAILVPGDPLVATTHIALIIDAVKHGFSFEIIPGVLISGEVSRKWGPSETMNLFKIVNKYKPDFFTFYCHDFYNFLYRRDRGNLG